MANDSDYDSMIDRLRQLTSDIASSLRVSTNKEILIRELAATLVTKQADIQIIREQMQFVRRPGLVASINAYRDLGAELELYEQQVKKIAVDLEKARSEQKSQSKIQKAMQAEFKIVENRLSTYGKILML